VRVFCCKTVFFPFRARRLLPKSFGMTGINPSYPTQSAVHLPRFAKKLWLAIREDARMLPICRRGTSQSCSSIRG
jgi:hypothetical protein